MLTAFGIRRKAMMMVTLHLRDMLDFGIAAAIVKPDEDATDAD